VKTFAHLSVCLVGAHRPDVVKTDKLPRAGLTELVGRICPAGRTLPTPAVTQLASTMASIESRVLMKVSNLIVMMMMVDVL